MLNLMDKEASLDTTVLRQHLLYLLEGGGAHVSFQAAVEGFPPELLGKRIPNLAHTAWQLVDHIRLAQWDIVEFVLNPAHVSPDYPAGYWPRQDAPEETRQWKQALEQIAEDLERMKALIRDPQADLFAPLPQGNGQHLLREAILIVDHNSYHTGQLVDLRMLLGVPVRDY